MFRHFPMAIARNKSIKPSSSVEVIFRESCPDLDSKIDVLKWIYEATAKRIFGRIGMRMYAPDKANF